MHSECDAGQVVAVQYFFPHRNAAALGQLWESPESEIARRTLADLLGRAAA